MVRIKFVNLVISPVYGNCAPGDIVACDEAFARHCVEDLRCASYLVPVPSPPETHPAVEASPERRRKGKR
jgi:hypothetical protein